MCHRPKTSDEIMMAADDAQPSPQHGEQHAAERDLLKQDRPERNPYQRAQHEVRRRQISDPIVTEGIARRRQNGGHEVHQQHGDDHAQGRPPRLARDLAQAEVGPRLTVTPRDNKQRSDAQATPTAGRAQGRRGW